MTQTRRMGVEGSKVRARFVDAAEEILREEGYHAISARHVAARAGLKTQLLYYYFRTMDDVMLAVLRRVNELRRARFDEVIAGPQPLRALWDLSRDPSGATLAAEMTSIASHRDAIRAEIVNSAREFRDAQIAAVSRILAERAGESGHLPADSSAAALVIFASALGRMLVMESALGLTLAHEEAIGLVEQALTRMGEGKAPV